MTFVDEAFVQGDGGALGKFCGLEVRGEDVEDTLIGCLGAVIDVSVTVTAAATELIERTRNLKFKGLLQSLHEIADDITGTMISVVLLTNIASTLPIFLISMSNEISFRTVINHDAYFYIARSFSGMLSIVVAILVSIFVTSLVARKELKHD